MTRRFVALVLTLAAATPVAAQHLVPMGARVRVRLEEPRRQAERRFSLSFLDIRGEVTAETADSLWVQPTRVTGSVGISKAGIRTLMRSRGEPRRLTSFFFEGIGGAIVGAIQGAVFYHAFGTNFSYFGGDTRAESAAYGAAYLAAIAGTIGFLYPVEYWRRVSLD